MSFTVTTTGRDQLGLRQALEDFANEQWMGKSSIARHTVFKNFVSQMSGNTPACNSAC